MAQRQYGYLPPKYGQAGYYKPPAVAPGRSLALAAAGAPGASDPFGLSSGQTATPFTTGAYGAPAAISTAPRTAGQAAPPAQAPSQTQPSQNAPQAPPTAGASGYDINVDPLLQMTYAFTGMNDEQAQAQALKQRQQELLTYGDPSLAAAVLGQSDPFVQAAGQNPTSTLAQLRTGHDQATHDLTEALNKENLLYGGARILKEGQVANDYENALARAAAGVNTDLSGIDSGLAAALAGSQQSRIQGMQDAYGRHATDAGAGDAAGSIADAIRQALAQSDRNASDFGPGAITSGPMAQLPSGVVQAPNLAPPNLTGAFAGLPVVTDSRNLRRNVRAL